jgi:hypothetical protein
MSTEQAIKLFLKGFFKASGLTSMILIAGYWQYFNSAIIIVGIIGGVMTMKDSEK